MPKPVEKYQWLLFKVKQLVQDQCLWRRHLFVPASAGISEVREERGPKMRNPYSDVLPVLLLRCTRHHPHVESFEAGTLAQTPEQLASLVTVTFCVW